MYDLCVRNEPVRKRQKGRERHSERKTEREGGRDRERERYSVCERERIDV